MIGETAVSTTAKHCHASRARSAAPSDREKSRRRQPASGVRRCLKFDVDDLRELVLVSKLVPTGGNVASIVRTRSRVESEAASTTAPSSAEQSPELACMVSDFEAWPSLPQVDDEWEALPSPALAIGCIESPEKSHQQDMCSWWIVDGYDATEPSNTTNASAAENEQTVSKPTFADLLRDRPTGPLNASCGTVMRRPPAKSFRQRHDSASAVDDESLYEERLHPQDLRTHGWTREHKASWNKKAQRKVATQKAQRVEQSCRSRGWTQGSVHDEV